MSLPAEVIVKITGYLPDVKTVLAASVSKKVLAGFLYNGALKNKHKFKANWVYNPVVVDLEIREIISSDLDLCKFRRLEKLRIKNLDINCDIAELSVKKLQVLNVIGTVKYFIKLKNTVKLTVLGNELDYFPFILNPGLKILSVDTQLQDVPESVEQHYFYKRDATPEGFSNANFKDLASNLLVMRGNTLCFQENLREIRINCQCPNLIELPKNLRTLFLDDYLSFDIKTIKFNQNIKYVDIKCEALSSLVFPESVKHLSLFLQSANEELFAPGVKHLKIDVGIWQISKIVFPKNLKKLSCDIYDHKTLELPKGLTELRLYINGEHDYVTLPPNLEKLYLRYDDDDYAKNVPVHNLHKLKKLSISYANKVVVLPKNIKKLKLTQTKVESIPDSVEILYVEEEGLPPTGKNLRKIVVYTQEIEYYRKKVKDHIASHVIVTNVL